MEALSWVLVIQICLIIVVICAGLSWIVDSWKGNNK